MSGVIQDGWDYVWGAYGLTGAVLLGYAIVLSVRLAQARRRSP